VLASDQVVRGPAKVLDGDNIVVAMEHVRLLAIDAPEDGQTCQSAGREWPCGEPLERPSRSLPLCHEVICRAPARDRYRRLLGTCFVGELNLTAEMVPLG
jgi:endonuclease YncB( thermonuclease family)